MTDLQLAVGRLRPVPDLAEFQLTIHFFRLLRVLDRTAGSERRVWNHRSGRRRSLRVANQHIPHQLQT